MAQQNSKKALAGAIAIVAGTVVSAEVLAQGCAEPFVIGKRTPVGEGPRGVAVGDLDGDGDLDAVAANLDSNDVTVLINDGDGNLASIQSLFADSRPDDIVLADFDGDGVLDFAVYASGRLTVRVAFGNGDGTFQDSQPLEQQRAVDLAAADVDGDGDIDLAIASNGLAFFPNDGTGSFGSPVVIEGSTPTGDVVVADVDGDGDLDLIGGSGETHIAVSINQEGEFAPPALYEAGIQPVHLAAGDIDGDGDFDVVASSYLSRRVAVVLNDGQGGFVPHAVLDSVRTNFEIALADVNGDGNLDIVNANAGGEDVGVMLGDGAGGFAPVRLYKTGLRVFDLVVADMDGDAIADIVASHQDGDSVGVLIGRGDGTFKAPQDSVSRDRPLGVASGDINGDGQLDIAMIQQFPYGAAFFLRDGAGYPGTAPLVPLASFPRSVELTDMDGDGDADAIYGLGLPGETASVAIAFSRGDGTFDEPITYPQGAEYVLVSTGDIDDDGDPDVVASVPDADTILIMLNQGDGSLADPIVVADAGRGPLKPELADLDLDGDLDVVSPESRANRLVLLLNDGAGGFEPRFTDFVDDYLADISVGDLDGDGAPDIAMAFQFRRQPAVIFNDGTGVFGPEVPLQGGLRGEHVEIAYTGEGRPNLVFASMASHPDVAVVSVFAGDGEGGFGLPQVLMEGNSFQALLTTDTNTDGIDDLLVVDTDDSVSIILGRCASLCRADIDGDGELTIFDFLAFFNAFDAGDPVADFDGDGELTLFDFLAFQNEFGAGCP